MEATYETRIINYALKTCGYYPLRAIQLWLINTHGHKLNSTMMNMAKLVKLPAETDLQRLVQAINDLVSAHDILHCRLVYHPYTSDICQRFDGEIIPVQVEKLSDEEFEVRKKNLMMPYEIINKPLYRIYVFETPTAKYGYADFYHAIMDGTSFAILFWRELVMRYQGKKFNRAPLKYADYILDELRVSPEELAEGNNFWRKMLEGFDKTKHLPPVDVQNAQAWKGESLTIQIENITPEYFVYAALKENVFFLAASMLALAKLIGAKSSIMSWIHNGRNTAQERRIMGIMLEQFPISWDFSQDISIEEFLYGLENKMDAGMKYRRSLGVVYQEGIEDDCVTFIFQKGIRTLEEIFLDGHPTQPMELPPSELAAAENSLDIEVNVIEKKYFLFLDYDASRYSENLMRKFAATFNEIVLQLQDEDILVSEILK